MALSGPASGLRGDFPISNHPLLGGAAPGSPNGAVSPDGVERFQRCVYIADLARRLQRLRPCYCDRIMSTAKQQVESLLHKLPENCSLEDIQYHLYVLEKVRLGLDDARQHGTVSQKEAEKQLGKWLTE